MADFKPLSKCKQFFWSLTTQSRAVTKLYQLSENPTNNVRIYDDQPKPVDVVRDIIEEQKYAKNDGDAFYAMDMGYIVEMIEKWKRLLPRVEPFYAIKANPDPVLLAMMAQLKIGYDCASMNEIKKILDTGNSPSRIIYAHTNKQPSHLQFASSAGITLTTFGDKDELYKIKQHAPDMGLLLRISTFSFTSSLYKVMTKKFGCHLNETITLLETAKELNLCVKGVSFHVGSRCTDPKAFARAIQESKRVFEEAASFGFQMTILDIGGGLPSKTTTTFSLPDPELSFEQFAETISESLEALFPVSSGVRVIAEPGACLSMPSTVLAANIIGTRDNRHKTDMSADAAPLEYFFNDGNHTSMGAIMKLSVEPVAVPVSNGYNEVAQFKCALWGQTCDFDLITQDCQLPEMKRGDWLYFTDVGAYSSVFCSDFNGFGPPRVHRYISEAMMHRFEVMVESLDYDGGDAMQEHIVTNGQCN